MAKAAKRKKRKTWRPKAMERWDGNPLAPQRWFRPPFVGITYRLLDGKRNPKTLRGALRTERRKVVWKCEHEHQTVDGAKECAAKERG